MQVYISFQTEQVFILRVHLGDNVILVPWFSLFTKDDMIDLVIYFVVVWIFKLSIGVFLCVM